MSLNSAEKAKIVKTYQTSKQDTGSSEVQVALLTSRIAHLSTHFKSNKKDLHSRYGMEALVNKRRKLLKYLKRVNLNGYRDLIAKLKLRDSY